MADFRSDDFRLRVSAVFTITGRGLVAAGVTERGSVLTGDIVEAVHDGRRTRATCRGVEMIYSRDPDFDPATIGLVLPELSKSDVAPGDLIEGVKAVP